MVSICIREFSYPQDYLHAVQLWQAIEKGIHMGPSDTPVEIEKKLKRDPDLFLVAEADGRLIGTVIGGYDGRRGFIYHLAVGHAHRGNGVGGRLMEEVEKRLRSKGCLRCYLFVTPDNEEAKRYYERRGWQLMDNLPYAKDLQS
jgi:ribosomal protein S18 acetylase RimI-like enzyme